MICLYVDWIDGNSIDHDPLIYIEGGGLILVGNLSKSYFPSFSRVWNSSDGNPEGPKIRQLLGLPEVESEVGLELLMFLRTPDVR